MRLLPAFSSLCVVVSEGKGGTTRRPIDRQTDRGERGGGEGGREGHGWVILAEGECVCVCVCVCTLRRRGDDVRGAPRTPAMDASSLDCLAARPHPHSLIVE
eukprot:GHVU01209402.1.p1 GENE.GHVU01209402.1~~GHVU01209402.1.p1  ORF type:complete len:102 (+),score=11.23 GHVU01209402.1:267-572(+)